LKQATSGVVSWTPTAAGSYTLSYEVSDAAGNAATEVQRTITIQ